MRPEQLDIFGGATPLGELPKPPNGRRYKTMQELYGKTAGKTCKSCVHLVCSRWNTRNYYKCELWYMSNSEATDIRLKNQACGRYEEENDG